MCRYNKYMTKSKLFEPEPKQFGIFWDYIKIPTVTDIDYNGRDLWITDNERGKYKVEDIRLTDDFIDTFANNIANSANEHFNKQFKVLEADTKELRISIIHNTAAVSGISICIRKSPCLIRNTIDELLESRFCEEAVLQLLINCVYTGMNFMIGGEPGAGKTEFAKNLMRYIRPEDRVITIEDTLEIHYPEINKGADAVELQVGHGFEYTDAIKASLRQNPKWLMLSEARSVEVTALLEQWSTGVYGFTTIHLDDVRKLPDRIINMMAGDNDAQRMTNRVYRYVDIGILIHRNRDVHGNTGRNIEQLCFYSRQEHENKCYMIVEDGEIVSKALPDEIVRRMREKGIEDPFVCKNFNALRKAQRSAEEYKEV